MSSLEIRNFRSFGPEWQGFDTIKPINLIIGKNSSGKTALIDAVEQIYSVASNLNYIINEAIDIIVGVTISEDFIHQVTELYAVEMNSAKESWHTHVSTYFKDFKNDVIKFRINADYTVTFLPESPNGSQFQNAFEKALKLAFKIQAVRRIAADRDIKSEYFDKVDDVDITGKGATNMIWRYLTLKTFDHNLIKKEFLKALNSIINPDISFTDIIVKDDASEPSLRQSSSGEIFFEDDGKYWVALSKMGSGLKTIIHVLLNLVVIPKHKMLEKSKIVFCFEELENNLHPSLQRRLFKYIIEYCKAYKSQFFITTHSNIAIDIFSDTDISQIVHVEKILDYSVTKVVTTQTQGISVLRDLDVRASDLLLSNGIIWVEGPSDAIYIEFLLRLYLSQVGKKDKLSYTIQSLSTSLWKWAGFQELQWNEIDENLENKIISLAEINHHHIIVIDKDDDFEDLRPSEWINFRKKTGQLKARLLFESIKYSQYSEANLINSYGDTEDGTLFYWVTEGTIETYLEFFIERRGAGFSKYFHKNRERRYFEKKRNGNNHSISKVELALQIVKFAAENALTLSDFAPVGSALENKLNRLFKTISLWNQ